MKREKIEIKENFINYLIEGELTDFEVIERKQQTHDPDDANLVIFVVKRKSDGKFFKGDYNWWPDAREFDDFSEELEEVFPKTKTITVYE